MKQKNGKSVKHIFRATAILPTAVMGMGLTVPATVAHASVATPDEIVVTARRTEEVIQNVPISMTVFNQEMLNERNVTNATDLVAYTPSLNTNTRFGSDQASFSIRGFTQDLGTTASVAVYFADVVAPRAGGGQITGGDGAGPGAFFDLQNVQVLKGPQGTLFGRNTTGGAIQLVPQEPTTKLEGYMELSAGNYDMRRAQGVVNVPISDNVRARFGLDTQRRDGYLENMSGIGPDRLADVDYLAGRASVMWDVSDTVQNYTILTYSHTNNNGTIQGLLGCDSNLGNGFAYFCQQTAAAQGHNFYNVVSADVPNPKSETRQWQAINTTTWDITDDLTVKNILSFADLRQTMRSSIFGASFGSTVPPVSFVLFPSMTIPGVYSNSQSTWVEELQFQGSALDERLTWQAGYYYEDSRPNDWTGSLSASLVSCDSALGADPTSWSCTDPLAALAGGAPTGNVGYNQSRQEFNNQAVYSQATYDLNDEWRATLGLRYTIDNTHADINRVAYEGFSQTAAGSAPTIATCAADGTPVAIGSTPGNTCLSHASQRSEAPTWLIDVDYLPTPDVMVYAKYARGYRQGNILPAAPPGLESYDPEKVDAYELGTKTSFQGPIPGTFNVALFYNELKQQQLQIGYVPTTAAGTGTTAIVNAGSSTIQGVEAETMLKLVEGLTFNLGYTYLETHLDSLSYPEPTGWAVSPSVEEGGHLSFSPRHTVTTGLNYQLPLPAEVGDVSAGATYTFTSSQFSTIEGPFATMPSRQLLNLNVGWKAIYGSAFDASFFMTNALGEKYVTFVSGLYPHVGAEFGTKGEPRMWGARVKYNF